MGLIYQITNKINGKKYIGQTKRTLECRVREHKRDFNRLNFYLYSALRKYDFENFQWSILEDNIQPEDLNDREKYWIKELNTFAPNGYNLTSGGGQGREVSLETRRKISNSRKGIVFSEEHRRNMSIARKSKTFSEQHKRSLSLAQIGRKHSQETKDKIGLKSKNRKQSEEQILNKSLYYQITDPEGNIFTIQNLRKFCRENNLNNSALIKVSQGKHSQHKNYKCEKLEKILN